MLPELSVPRLASVLPSGLRHFFHRNARGINTLAVPFLPDDGVAEDDCAPLRFFKTYIEAAEPKNFMA